jgi:deoxyribodipyrimidine photo-lyase
MIRQIDGCRIAGHSFILAVVMQKPFTSGLVWFRRDLRTQDNPALLAALQACEHVYCVFVFDQEILSQLPPGDRRVGFIHACVLALDQELRSLAGRPDAGLIALHGKAPSEIPQLALGLGVQIVFAAHDYDPKAQTRDKKVRIALNACGITLTTVKDHVIFEQTEVQTKIGKPYTVFTPYLRTWLAQLQSLPRAHAQGGLHGAALMDRPSPYAISIPPLSSLGFAESWPQSGPILAGSAGANALLEDFWDRMDNYNRTRDFPAVKGPSYLGVHLRFGTVSIRQLVHLALQRHLSGSAGASVWLGELGWRDFYFQILANFPHVVDHAFKPAYDQITWERGAHADRLFQAWCAGRTGYPLVDAAMAQLNQSGYMHNRLRMVAASFLVKHLGIHWGRGEHYFAEKLNDFDLAANNGGWQWVSSSGCDAQPYFRIFNPITQSQRFDPQGTFIKRYLPTLAKLSEKAIHAPWQAKPVDLSAAGVILGGHYPQPIVDHAQARAKTLERYAVVRNGPQASTASLQ